MKKPDHIYRWRTSWKQRRLNARPTEDAVFRRLLGRFWDDTPLDPIPETTSERLGEVLLIFLMQRMGGMESVNASDILAGTGDLDSRQPYMRIAEFLDRKGRLTYFNQERNQYQKTDKPLLIADLLNEQLPYSVTPQDVLRAQRIVINDGISRTTQTSK